MKTTTSNKKRFAVFYYLIIFLLVFGLAPAGSVNAQEHFISVSKRVTPLSKQLREKSIELLTDQLALSTTEHEIIIENILIENTSARLDISLKTTSDFGTFEESIRIFAIHNNVEVKNIFREPSEDYYKYIDYISPNLVDKEIVEFWKGLREEDFELAQSFIFSNDQDALPQPAATTTYYYLPWDGGKAYIVFQDYNKHFDFQTPVGTNEIIIRAARGGQVYNGVGSKFGETYVRILHSDGTYGFYVHLKANSYKVASGKSVSRGDCIGISGATGKLDGPHTHFNVSKSSSNGDAGIPFGSGWVYVEFIEGAIVSGQVTPQSKNISGICAKPVSVTGVQASDGDFLDYVQVTYNNVSNAARHEIWRNTTNDPSTAKKIFDDLGSPFPDKIVTAGTIYYYWIKACNYYGCSDFSVSDSGYKGTLPTTETVTFPSNSSYDGHVMESTETSGVGGSTNSSTTALVVGDDVSRRQYRGILSFDTSGLPDNAVITSITLRFKYAGVVGTNPFSTLGNLLVDVRTGTFYSSIGLQKEDFQAASSKSSVLSFTNSTVDGWYSKAFASTNFGYINKTGVTQFRLRFATDDNGNNSNDYLKIYSGNSGAPPELIIIYYVP